MMSTRKFEIVLVLRTYTGMKVGVQTWIINTVHLMYISLDWKTKQTKNLVMDGNAMEGDGHN